MKDVLPAWSVVIIVPKGEHFLLAINRGFNTRNPALPGGDSIPEDESPAHTAQRELLEETGLYAAELRCVDQRDGERGQPVFTFFCPKFRGKLRVSGEGKPFWTSPERLLIKTAEFRGEAQRLLENLGVVPPLVAPIVDEEKKSA